MAYQLKSTGIAANCTMCIAVDPDTNTIKDFASSSVTADMTVGANVTISEQAWDGITRKYFRLGSGTAADDFVAFGTTKPQWDFNSGESRTIVAIAEVAGAQMRVCGKDSGSYFASQNTGAGGATFPTFVAASSISGGAAALSAGAKRIFGFSLVYGTSSTAYYAADTDSAMTVASGLSALSPSGTTFDYAVGYVGRRNDSTAHQQDKIHAVLIFNTALSESDFDALRDDWFTTLLESASDVTAPVLTSPSFTATGTSTGTASVSTNEGNGTLYCVVTTSSTSPSAAQIKAGNDHTGSAAAFAAGSGAGQAVSGTGTQNVNATGLSPSTTYYAHFVHDDAAANESNVASDATGDTTDAADVTAPTLSSPTGTGGTLTCTGSVSTNEGNGTLYCVVTDSATAPSAAQVKAGQDHTGSAALRVVSQAVSGTGVQSIGSGAVTAGTRYWHYMHEDAATNQSTVATSASFTVSASANDIRLQPALDLLSGADAASLSGLRWTVFTDGTASAVAHSGGSLTTNSSGQPTIDINGSDFSVDDWVLLMVSDPDASEPTEADRIVGVFLGWVQATAQA